MMDLLIAEFGDKASFDGKTMRYSPFNRNDREGVGCEADGDG